MATGYEDWTKPSGLTWTQIRNLLRTEGAYNYFYDEDNDKVIDYAHLPAFRSLLQEIEVTSNTNSIDISGLDILTDKYYTIVFLPVNNDPQTVIYEIYVNGDLDATNYDGVSMDINDSASSVNQTGVLFMQSDNGAVVAGIINILKTPQGYVLVDATSFGLYGARMGRFVASIRTLVTHTNVTKITISSPVSSLAIGSGSKILVYGK